MNCSKMLIKHDFFFRTLENTSFVIPTEDSFKSSCDIKVLFINKICRLIKGTMNEKGHLVFRGQKRAPLHQILVRDHSENTDLTLYNHLFYYGEKAVCFYRSESLQDAVKNTERQFNLFEMIRKELKKEKNNVFVSKNRELYSFFNNSCNRTLFDKAVENDVIFYSYYNSFLHTLGKRKGLFSHYLSSSALYNIALDFAQSTNPYVKENNTNIPNYPLILVYALPTTFPTIHAFRDMSDKQKRIEDRLKEIKLPCFVGEWIYEKQKEYVLLCGMLPQLIWGVIDIIHNVTIVNPHILDKWNDINSLFLYFDQSDFSERREKETNYRYAYALDGFFYPHLL